MYQYTSLQSEGNKVTYRMLAKHAKFSRGFARKIIIKEVKEYGGVIAPSSKKKRCRTGIVSRDD
eukprot:scaffold305_cov60-Attheya_sp.AAC.8